MTSIPPPVDAQGYLENLMRAGQDAMKQFDDSLASVAGVSSNELLPSGHLFAPLDFDRRLAARVSQAALAILEFGDSADGFGWSAFQCRFG